METLTISNLQNAINFDCGTIYLQANGERVRLEWDSENNVFTDSYYENSYTEEQVFNAPIVEINSKQGYGNTLFVVIKL